MGKPSKGRGDRNKKQSALHLVSAWASENRLLLGQVKVESKTNEFKAIPVLLELLDISGCIITIDAMGTQHEIARQIVAKDADYVLCLKANHPTLWAQVKAWYELALNTKFEGIDYSYARRIEAGHHRREHRVCLGSSRVLHGTVAPSGAMGRSSNYRHGKTSAAFMEQDYCGGNILSEFTSL